MHRSAGYSIDRCQPDEITDMHSEASITANPSGGPSSDGRGESHGAPHGENPGESTGDSSQGDEPSRSEHEQIPISNSLVPLSQEEQEKPAHWGWLSWLFGLRRGSKSNIREDLSDALAEPDHADGGFTPEERLMLNNILRLQDVRVEDLMIPRAEIEAASIDTTLGELLTRFEVSGHSRMPIVADSLDDPRGMIHIRDVVAYITKTAASGRRSKSTTALRDLDLTKVDLTREIGKLNLTRKLIFVPPSMMAAELMARMQAQRIQIALVIDEYGGTEGLISLEDIVELIVGDIEDEHDDDEELIRIGEAGTLHLDAKAEIVDIREFLNGNFHVGDHDDDAETIGGVIFSLLGRVPVKGEVVDAFGYEFRIKDADPRRIRSIDMLPSKKTALRKKKAEGKG